MAEYSDTFLWPPDNNDITTPTINTPAMIIGMDMAKDPGMSASVMYDSEGNMIRYHTEHIQVKEKRYPRRYYVYRITYNIVIILYARSVSDARRIAEQHGYISTDKMGVYNTHKPLRGILSNYKGKRIGVGIFLLKDVKIGIRKILLGV